jgi:hypothetical protein
LEYLSGSPIVGGTSCQDANVIKDNNGDAVYIAGSPAFNYNDVYNNTGFELINGSSATFDASNCYWGTTKEDVVKAEIWDKLDEQALGLVTYKPFSTTPCKIDDTTPPAAVTDLATSSPTATSITLTWTAPGDDGNVGTAKMYDVRYSKSPITGEASWNAATQCAGEPLPQPAGLKETFIVWGLSSSTTYHFAMKTAGEVDPWSGLSNDAVGTTSSDSTPPSAVTNLFIFSIKSDSVTLNWTAPGDDGNVGTATTYDIRYSKEPITDANWVGATQCQGESAPKPAGSSESFTVKDLSPNTVYYFAMKTADEVPNWSALSNVPSILTNVPCDTTKTCDANGDGKVSAYDALIILQYVVGVLDKCPVERLGTPGEIPPQDYILRLPDLSATAGKRVQVPITIDVGRIGNSPLHNTTGLIVGGVSLKYDATVLRAVGVSALDVLNGAYWQGNIDLEGEVRFAFVSAPLTPALSQREREQEGESGRMFNGGI